MNDHDQSSHLRKLLRESAPLAREWSDQSCASGVYGGNSCRWYHGVWQYLALLDVVSTPWREQDFFFDVLAGVLNRGEAGHVLVSGASDYAMLALVVEAARGAGHPVPRCVVVDACPTPLRLNQWYAERMGVACEIVNDDILSANLPEPFDLVCTHSFLGNFPPADRPALVARWHALLRPGGRVVTINRIRAGVSGPVRFTPAQAADFQARAVAAARAASGDFGVDPATLSVWAECYTRTYSSNPVTAVSDLRRLFLGNGFFFERLDIDDSDPDNGGPSSTVAGVRARLVARRLD